MFVKLENNFKRSQGLAGPHFCCSYAIKSDFSMSGPDVLNTNAPITNAIHSMLYSYSFYLIFIHFQMTGPCPYCFLLMYVLIASLIQAQLLTLTEQ